MVYKKYGDIFRKLREQHHLPLSSFSSAGISKTALSNFERGESMMSFEKVVVALQIMGVSLEEFEHFLNGYSLSDSDFLLEEIEKETVSQNFTKLKMLYTKARSQGYPYLALAAKSSWSALDEEETEKLVDLLYETEVWGYKEICVCYLTINNFSTRDILTIIDSFLVPGQELFNSLKYRGYLVQVCCRAVTTLSSRGYKEYAEHILNRIDAYSLVHTMFHRNLRNITKGYWIYCFVDAEEGKAMMSKGIQIFKDISTPEVAGYYQSRYEHFVEQLD
ncbi:helix-turn-helix domain-containing protein (plasmid) [Lactococcus garvieae]|uniref:Rgg/GadR/MutR family transcriptional regulator n=1 Tax=Lactococcus garvieae TaxID=1363 RepID=UPI0030D09C52